MPSPPRPVPVLMYHEVSPRPHPGFERFTVTPRAFARQVGWLARAGYTAVGMDELLAARGGGVALPRRPVAITFDDGFAECARHAAPVLLRHGFTATFYLVAGEMGGTSRWLARELGFELPMMSWDDARALEARGLRCGSHTLTHPRLARIDPGACREELVESRLLLERHLGRPERHLAYPFGSFDARVQRLAAEAGYATACTTEEGFSAPDDPPLALRRIPVYGGESQLDFVCRLLTAHPTGHWARRLRRRLPAWGRHGRSAG